MTAEHVVQARGITVRFQGLTALDEVDLDVAPRTVVGLIGPNGAGKSTLFSVLSGLRRPAAGTVRLMGEDVTSASPQRRAALGMARTFQSPELFGGLTVREHITLSVRLARTPRRLWTDTVTAAGFHRPKRDETQRVDEVIEGLKLERLAGRMATGLPLGQARLVEIARAIAREPRVLLLDEASSGLDASETEELAAVLRRLVEQRGVSLLLVEHDVELVLGLAARVTVLDFGKVIADDVPDVVRRDPAVRAAYLGEAPDTVAATETLADVLEGEPA